MTRTLNFIICLLATIGTNSYAKAKENPYLLTKGCYVTAVNGATLTFAVGNGNVVAIERYPTPKAAVKALNNMIATGKCKRHAYTPTCKLSNAIGGVPTVEMDDEIISAQKSLQSAKDFLGELVSLNICRTEAPASNTEQNTEGSATR